MSATHRVIRLVDDYRNVLFNTLQPRELPIPRVATRHGRIFVHTRTDRYMPLDGDDRETATFLVVNDVFDANLSTPLPCPQGAECQCSEHTKVTT